MNERIRELAEQAVRELVYEHDDAIGGVMDVWKFQNKDIQKFAELIVRECMRVSMKSAGMDAEYEAWYLIQEHFGVE